MGNASRVDFGFSSAPPEVDERHEFEIVRLGPGKKIRGIVLSEHLICRETHYVQKRTVPHHETGCPYCLANEQKRWYGWVALFSPTSGNTCILEFPAKPLATFVKWQKERGSLRGVELAARRRGREINGPVFVDLSHGTMAVDCLPAGPDVQLCLLRMWGFDPGLPGLGVAVARHHRLNGHEVSQ